MAEISVTPPAAPAAQIPEKPSPSPAAKPAATEDTDTFLGVKPVPWWRRYGKWLGLAAIVVIAIIVVWRLIGGPAPSPYVTTPVRRGALQVTVSATGRLAPVNQVQVGSELSGLVTKVLVDVNYPVKAGQALALVDPARFADAVRQSAALLGAAEAAVAVARATLAQTRAQLDRQETVFRLSGGRVPSGTDLATARADLGRAGATLAQTEANVGAARAVLSSDRINLTKTVIRSPVNGVVLTRQIEPGQTVAASFNTPTLFVIAQDLSQMKLPVAVDEADVGDVAEGQKAQFTVDAFPGESFPAIISRVDVGSNLSALATTTTATTASNALVVSYNANLTVTNTNLRLRPGMTATAQIVTRARPDVLLVPNAALRFTPSDSAAAGGGGFASALSPHRTRRSGAAQDQAPAHGKGASRTVFVLDQATPRAVAIETGVSDGSQTEVTGGALKPGMLLITGQLAAGGS